MCCGRTQWNVEEPDDVGKHGEKTQSGVGVRLVLLGLCKGRFGLVAGNTILAVPLGGIEGFSGSTDQCLGGGKTVLWQASNPETGGDLSGVAEGAIGQRLADAFGMGAFPAF
jgi:hypothetical protein